MAENVSIRIPTYSYTERDDIITYSRLPPNSARRSLMVWAKPQMVLWLIAQGFNLLELLTYTPVDPHGSMSHYIVGYLVGNRYTDWFDLEHAKYFSPEQKKEAFEYTDAQKPRQRMYRLVDERLHENDDNEVNIDKVCNWMLQHGIISHMIESFKKDMED